jgi:rRNA maturation endonuclease Nob1
MLDGVLQFLVTLVIYFIIFGVIGMIFWAADSRVRNWLRRPMKCSSCNARFDASLLQKHHGRCPTCGVRLSAGTSKSTSK